MKNVIIVIIAFTVGVVGTLMIDIRNKHFNSNVPINSTQKCVGDVEFSHPLYTVASIEELYIELDRLLALRSEEFSPLELKYPELITDPKVKEDLTKLNAEINTLMGVIGDAQRKLNNFNEVYLKNSH